MKVRVFDSSGESKPNLYEQPVPNNLCERIIQRDPENNLGCVAWNWYIHISVGSL